MNIPNIISSIRVALIPLIVYFFSYDFEQSNLIASILLIIATLSDVLDGYIARKFNQHTLLGSILDPIADKLLVVISLILLVHKFQLMMVTICSIILIGREIVVMGLREAVNSVDQNARISVSLLGKLKTIFQMSSLVILFLASVQLPLWIISLGLHLLAFSTILSIVSMANYLNQAINCLTLIRKSQ
ncbi:MAG: CDP-diacylglycerol--glycerol-3-phosphate 3-phosphatidyltransferase [Legionellales bacterium]|nr:CDP-diacylglycerol--glycerol-3-phosphate 3-phosphatidyltransferase [Legionellales bacterium]